MTAIMEVFLSGPARMSLEEVTDATGLPRSTAFRIMAQLVELRWLEHQGRGYRVGPRGRVERLDIDGSWGQRLIAAAQWALTEMAAATGGRVRLGVLQGANVEVVQTAGSPRVLPGVRDAVHRDPLGLALLSAMTPERVDDLVAFAPQTPRACPADLHRLLNRVQRRPGLVLLRAGGLPTADADTAAVVIPQFGANPTAAMSVEAPTRLPIESVLPLLAVAAGRVGRQLAQVAV